MSFLNSDVGIRPSNMMNKISPKDLASSSSSLMQSPSALQPMMHQDIKPVTLHPLIIGDEIIVCMPEVNKVLRNVYQVLSQANYYLSKHAISSRRFTGAQLIKIKMLGVLNHDAKVCSHILQSEAERIFDSFDLNGSCRKSSRIIWSEPILLDEGYEIPPGKARHGNHRTPTRPSSPVEVQTFYMGGDEIVCAPDIQRVIQMHFNQGATTGYYFAKLGIVPYKFIHSAHLDKVKQLGIIKKSAVHCTYVTRRNAERVFGAYGMSDEDISERKVKWLHPILLPEIASQGWSPLNSDASNDQSRSPGNGSDLVVDEENRSAGTPSGMFVHDDQVPTKVNVFIVDGKEVVCMPDIHKVVQYAHGNSIQVNYYLNKLLVKKKRFCFAHLKELKSRGILQGNATYCTFIPRAEAKKIFQIYSLMGDSRISEIEWGDPVRLDRDFDEGDSNGGDALMGDDGGVSGGNEPSLKVNTFLVDSELVVCTPDVHKMVDYIEEQSASLDYHFRKLGIAKHRFTYSQLHQLRRLQVIKRPTVCTFIKKIDVERLLRMYATERNKRKMNNIIWLEGVPLVPSDHGPYTEVTSNGPSKASMPETTNTEVNGRSTSDTNYTISDLYSVFVGDRNEAGSQQGDGAAKRPSHAMEPGNTMLSPTSSAALEVQRANPHIDCPIVIPSGDFDPSKLSRSNEISTSTQARMSETALDTSVTGTNAAEYVNRAKRSRVDDGLNQQLLKDLGRKETELRPLHDAYTREVNEEKKKNLQMKKSIDDMRESHARDISRLTERLQKVEEQLHMLISNSASNNVPVANAPDDAVDESLSEDDNILSNEEAQLEDDEPSPVAVVASSEDAQAEEYESCPVAVVASDAYMQEEEAAVNMIANPESVPGEDTNITAEDDAPSTMVVMAQ